MDILKTLSHPLSALDRKPTGSHLRTPVIDDARPTPAEPVRDRRFQPDRRRRQQDYTGPDRRMRNSRRQPLLLNPRTRQATPLEDRRGRLLETKA
ncbi:hypothetical protein [uncultured Marinobacter sp.]|uniref:hypothetical protein n=1 Tax=uncultured Marinobacter sp. TaxID=187379 RepID=UPI0030DB3903